MSYCSLSEIEETPNTILIDTNVLLWIFYERSVHVKDYQKKEYPKFFADRIDLDRFIVTTISLSELFNIIEKNEYKIFCISNKENSAFDCKRFKIKDYRRIKPERERLKKCAS